MDTILIFVFGFCSGIITTGFVMTILYQWMDED